jgi:hypothetical protein
VDHSRPRLSVPTLPKDEPVPMNGYAVEAMTGDARGKRIANRTPWLDLPEPFDNLQIRAAARPRHG